MKGQKITEKTLHDASALLLQDIMREEEACAEQLEPSPEFRERMESLLRNGGRQDPGVAREKPSSQTGAAEKGGRKITLKAILIIAAVMCIFAIAVSAGNNKPGVTPTGASDGEIQVPCFYYDGDVYWHVDMTEKPLPEEYKNVGTINKIDNINYPAEDFAGARLEIGMEVYAVPGEKRDVLYLKMEPNANYYWIFKIEP